MSIFKKPAPSPDNFREDTRRRLGALERDWREHRDLVNRVESLSVRLERVENTLERLDVNDGWLGRLREAFLSMSTDRR